MVSSLQPVRQAAGWVATEWRSFIATVAIGCAPGLAGIVLLEEGDRRATDAIGGLIGLYLALLVTARVLEAAGAMPPDHDRRRPTEGRFFSAFLASLLTVIGIGLGLALLILPGILIYTLWSLWMPALLAERLRVTGAMRRSWELLRPRWRWALLLSLWVGLIWAGSFVPAIAAATIGAGDRMVDATLELIVKPVQLFVAAVYARAWVLVRRDEDEAGA